MLNCKALSVFYSKKIQAIVDLSLEVRAGEIVALIGANGAGKSTFLKALSGLIPVAQGEIIFNGVSLVKRPAHSIAALGIAHVPEGRRIFSALSVLENLHLGSYREPQKIKERLCEIFELFPLLKERAEQLGGTLSGGEQQMLAMARGLMSDPKLLLLDEPSMGLAPIMVKKIYDIIAAIRNRGKTILLVEQNAEASLCLSDRGYVLENGRLALEGLGAELAKNPLVQKAYLGH